MFKIQCVQGGRLTSFCLFHGPGRSVEVQEGGKISITLGLLINIYYIVQMSIFIFTFLPSVKFQNVNFLKIYIKMYNVIYIEQKSKCH